MQTQVITFKSFRSRQTARRILAGETLALAFGKHIVADIVPRRPQLKRRATLAEIMEPIHAAAAELKRQGAKPGRDLILEDRERFRR